MIEAPIVVTGPARSGTTILFELLGLDPGLRTPVATDVLHPAPPAGVDDAARFAMTESEQELWADVQPEFAAIHELRSDLPGRVHHDLCPVVRREPLGDGAGRPGGVVGGHRRGPGVPPGGAAVGRSTGVRPAAGC